jgi:hypothetical protein
MQAHPAAKRNLLTQLIALLLFVIIGGLFALPVFSHNGEIAGRSKALFVILVFGRLAWQIHKSTFRFRNYFIYFALVIGFCVGLDSYWRVKFG